MKICGLKLSHDAAVAGIEDGKLLFCVEIEKLDNRPRYTKMTDLSLIDRVLSDFRFEPDVMVVDGWKAGRIKESGLPVATYHEFDGHYQGLLTRRMFDNEVGLEYASYPHIAGHIAGTYATSPFAAQREPAYVITWDGGQNPRIHFVDPSANDPMRFVGKLHELYGIIYGIMGYYYGPYKNPDVWRIPLADVASKALYGGYDKPGKLMSWIALGKPSTELLAMMELIYDDLALNLVGNLLDYRQNGILEHEFMREVQRQVFAFFNWMSDADVLATVHTFLRKQLVLGATATIPKGSNLCFTGGSALNIKWNSALRATGHFANVWVPPFPNDSGSALGAACCEMMLAENRWELDWSVYCGPRVPKEVAPDGWTERTTTTREIAWLLHRFPEEPIVALNGRAELGPRALGNRSILCNATVATNQALLNDLKAREQFRPVAPICLEARAPSIFNPGTRDPFMLFDHVVRGDWRRRIPAVVHLDWTARLQTVSPLDNPLIAELLIEYEKHSGIPVLCNTSANFNGSGFFPDVASAARWGKVRRIWSDGTLYERSEP